MISVRYTRLLSRGDLAGSDGGIYNPGAVQTPEGIFTICRREEDYTWTQPCHAALTRWDPKSTPARWVEASTHTLIPIGHDPDVRLEDFRPFWFDDQVLVAHTRWKPFDRRYPIKPVLSVLSGDAPTLTRYDDWHLPVLPQPVEKNWALIEHDHRLHTVYSLDPLTVFRRVDHRSAVAPGASWVLVSSTLTDWTARLGKPPRLSCHLLPFRGGYLGWWHVYLDQWYVHGAYWLDEKLRLRARTGILLDGQWVRGDVFKPGCLYVSSQILSANGETLYLFYGEGDAHAGVAEIAVSDVLDVLRFNTNGATL